MSSNLPHLQHFEERPLAEIVALVRDDAEGEECYLAVSYEFYELEEQAKFDEVFRGYYDFFANTSTDLAGLLGQPSFRGRSDSAEFPEWAQGDEITVWADGLWLRIEHEDRELPIIVALAQTPE